MRNPMKWFAVNEDGLARAFERLGKPRASSTSDLEDLCRVTAPLGKSGPWEIRREVVDNDPIRQLREARDERGRYVPGGTYTLLSRDGDTVMSDTPNEIQDLLEPLSEARKRGGHVLVNGLGLGIFVGACLRLPNVRHVTVIEKSPDVIKLVAPALRREFRSARFRIIEADAMLWKPPSLGRFTVVWHDIWDTIDPANLPSMTILHRRYGRRCDWQGSWAQAQCRRLRDEDDSGW